MNKIIKLTSLILLMIIVVSALSNIAFADEAKTGTSFSKLITDMGASDSGNDAVTSARTIVGAIISVMRIVAVGVAIIMLVVLAMKYMMAAPGDKADIKKHAVVYVVGAVVLFASSGILGIISDFASNISYKAK